MIKIHGAAPSPIVRKVREALAEKGIADELIHDADSDAALNAATDEGDVRLIGL